MEVSEGLSLLRQALASAGRDVPDGDAEVAAAAAALLLEWQAPASGTDARPPSDGNGSGAGPLVIRYRNWRGEEGVRTITPCRLWHGGTEWHPEPQWLLTAWDHEKDAVRDFALRDFQGRP